MRVFNGKMKIPESFWSKPADWAHNPHNSNSEIHNLPDPIEALLSEISALEEMLKIENIGNATDVEAYIQQLWAWALEIDSD
jgi:hypothetical protein